MHTNTYDIHTKYTQIRTKYTQHTHEIQTKYTRTTHELFTKYTRKHMRRAWVQMPGFVVQKAQRVRNTHEIHTKYKRKANEKPKRIGMDNIFIIVVCINILKV